MKITIISGSHRSNSQSYKVAQHINSVLQSDGVATYILDLSNNPLPLWDEGVWNGEQKWLDLMTAIKEELASSDAFVVITPEYHGQVPAGLKNLFLLLSKHEVGNKPALIVAVSSSDGGSYPVAELRMSSYKNNRLCYIPDHLILRNIETILNKDAALNNEASHTYFKERIVWSLGLLKQYAIALKLVRDSGAADTDKFNNGM